jgi:biopolymer transport protein TolQ
MKADKKQLGEEFWERMKPIIGDSPYSWASQHGIPKSSFQSAYERRAKPLDKTLDKWAELIGVDAHWLKTGAYKVEPNDVSREWGITEIYPANGISIEPSDYQQPEQQKGVVSIFQHGVDEYHQLIKDEQLTTSDVIDGVERRLLSSISEEEEKLQQNLTFLATVGSVSPYIGLFGTVWGIMNAFIGLSAVEQATLNTVAPGIAEALIATAIGLFAAIPAVVAYNRFSARADKLSSRYYGFANELQTRIYRLLGHTERTSR